MIKHRGFSLIEGLLITLVIAIVGAGGFYVVTGGSDEKKNIPEGVSIRKEECIGPEVEGGPACIPAHYNNFIDVNIIRNDGNRVQEMYVDGQFISGDDFYNNKKEVDKKISILEQEKCREIGGFYERSIYVGGVAGFNNLCLVDKD